MKKLTSKILAIAAAFAFASVFASCSFLDESDDSILSYFDPSALSAVNNGGSGNSGSGSSGSGSNGGSTSGVTVNATFSLTGTAESAASNKDYDITASGTGATLHFTGNAKQEATALNVQKATGVSVSSFTGSKGVFTLVLNGSATVTVHYKGSGAAETARAIIIANSSDVLQKGIDNIGNDAEHDFATDAPLAAGSYKIYCNGIKIYSITCN